MIQQCDDGDTEITISKQGHMLFNTEYFAVKYEIPLESINGMLTLQTMNGININDKNLSWDTISDIQKAKC